MVIDIVFFGKVFADKCMYYEKVVMMDKNEDQKKKLESGKSLNSKGL